MGPVAKAVHNYSVGNLCVHLYPFLLKIKISRPACGYIHLKFKVRRGEIERKCKSNETKSVVDAESEVVFFLLRLPLTSSVIRCFWAVGTWDTTEISGLPFTMHADWSRAD